MKNELEFVGTRVPYNSATQYLEKNCLKPTKELGGNCVFQLNTLTQMLGEASVLGRISYIQSDFDGITHFAMLLREGRDEYYLDPFVMHSEPIKLSAVKKKGRQFCGAIPRGNKVMAEHLGEGHFGICVFAPSDQNGHFLLREYRFDTDLRRNSLPSFGEYVGQGPEKLSLRLVEPTLQSLITLHYYLATGIMNIGQHNQGGTKSIFRRGTNPEKFEEELEKMARIMGVSKADIYNLLFRAEYYAVKQE